MRALFQVVVITSLFMLMPNTLWADVATCNSKLQEYSVCRVEKWKQGNGACGREYAAYVSCTDGATPGTKCFFENQFVKACKEVVHVGSKCPSTSTALNACNAGTGNVGHPTPVSAGSASSCDAIKEELIGCWDSNCPSSCPRTSKKMRACCAENGLAEASCFPVKETTSECKPGAPPPRTTTVKGECADMPKGPHPVKCANTVTDNSSSSLESRDEDSSEVVNGGASFDALTSCLPIVKDLPDCKLHSGPRPCTCKDCWLGKNLAERVENVVANINYLNRLHNGNVDPAYFVCTGWRESQFDPGGESQEAAQGLFQVIRSTGIAALDKGAEEGETHSRLPGFRDLSAIDYRKQMPGSSAAQSEISYLTLMLKWREAPNSLKPGAKDCGTKGDLNKVINGTGGVEDYKRMAWRYIGCTNQGYAKNYRDNVAACYACIAGSDPKKTSLLLDPKKHGGAEMKNCLSKARRSITGKDHDKSLDLSCYND